MLDELPPHIIAKIIGYLDNESLLSALDAWGIMSGMGFFLDREISARLEELAKGDGAEMVYEEGVSNPCDILEISDDTEDENEAPNTEPPQELSDLEEESSAAEMIVEPQSMLEVVEMESEDTFQADLWEISLRIQGEGWDHSAE